MNQNGKIQTLNMALRQAIPYMQRTAEKHPEAEILVRTVKFASGAEWHNATPTLAQDFQWQDLAASGETHMGKALALVAEELKIPPMSGRALPPVLVLVSDGMPTDDFETGLRTLLAQPWGQKATRLAIGIGQDADHKVLKRFIGNPEIQSLQANNPEMLVEYFKWVSSTVLDTASDIRTDNQVVETVKTPPPPPKTDSVMW
jgi:uncharacterized protein YegL